MVIEEDHTQFPGVSIESDMFLDPDKDLDDNDGDIQGDDNEAYD